MGINISLTNMQYKKNNKKKTIHIAYMSVQLKMKKMVTGRVIDLDFFHISI